MLKLIDQSLLSTKTGHNYWKYSRYNDTVGRYIEWIIENIENSKDGHIRVKVNDFIKEPGHDIFIMRFANSDDNNQYMGDKPWNGLFHTLKLEDCPVLKTR